MSRGLLIPDHVLLRRQQMICQEMLETPDVSEEVVSNSHQMSFSSQMPLDQTQEGIKNEVSLDDYAMDTPIDKKSNDDTLRYSNVLQLTDKDRSIKTNFLYPPGGCLQRTQRGNSSSGYIPATKIHFSQNGYGPFSDDRADPSSLNKS